MPVNPHPEPVPVTPDDGKKDEEVTPAPEPQETVYNIGDEVSFSDKDWYILSVNEDSYTLVSKELDYSDSIYFDYDILFGMIKYFQEDKLKYEDSAMKLYLEEEILPQLGELKEVDGYKIRLLTLEDIKKVIPLKEMTDDNDLTYYLQDDDADYSWLLPVNTWCWTMEECQDDVGNTVYGETASQQFTHYSWYIMTNYNGIAVTSVGTQRDDSIKIVINVDKARLDEISH